jgi:hypothetical protein
MNEQRKEVEEKVEEQEPRMASAHLSERREVRYEVPIEIEISGVDGNGQVFHERTFTRDVSDWGCGFTTTAELKVDDIFVVSIVDSGEAGAAPGPKSMFQVVRVAREGAGWLIGAWKMNRENFWGAALEKASAREGSGESPAEAASKLDEGLGLRREPTR